MSRVLRSVVSSKLSTILLDTNCEGSKSSFSKLLDLLKNLMLVVLTQIDGLSFTVNSLAGSLEEIIRGSLDEHKVVIVCSLFLDKD